MTRLEASKDMNLDFIATELLIIEYMIRLRHQRSSTRSYRGRTYLAITTTYFQYIPFSGLRKLEHRHLIKLPHSFDPLITQD